MCKLYMFVLTGKLNMFVLVWSWEGWPVSSAIHRETPSFNTSYVTVITMQFQCSFQLYHLLQHRAATSCKLYMFVNYICSSLLVVRK